MRVIPLLEPIRPDLERSMRLLLETLAQVGEPFGSELRYLVEGGKCVRPALVVLVGRLFSAEAVPFHKLAAAVEVLHTATLIHDDLVDGAALRRGRETLHTSWPAGVTVLVGDALLAQTAALVARLGRPRILEVFAEALCAMSAGEIGQLLSAGESRYGREGYYRRIEAKTASLCAAATEMAAILAEAEEVQIAALRRFGWELGIAFQIADDVLDFVGDEAQLGKPAGSDLRQGLVTLPVICHLEQAGDDAAVEAVLAGQRDEGHVRAAVEAIRASGAVDAALDEARSHARQAREALAAFPDGDSRRVLLALADYAVERRR
ncbi:MAG: polyprenyl synthetase family protein [Anaerolineae bacterium]|nr:polyprenyl synthetase family protein [Anaerolineae bacterium]